MMKSWLKRWLTSPAAPVVRRRVPVRSTLFLSMERLEDRIEMATLTWTGAVNNLWATAGNWLNETNQTQAPAAGDDLIVPSTASNLVMNNNTTAGTNYHSLTFSGAGASVVLTGNGFTIGDANGGGIFQNFTGIFSATIGVASLTLASGTAKTFASATAGSTLVINSALGLNGVNLQIGQTGAGAGNVRFQQAINGSGSITKIETGIAIFAAVSNYVGATNVNGGTLQLALANVIPNATSVSLNSIGATLDLNGFAETIGDLSGVVGSTVTLGLAGILNTGGSGSSTTFAGLITGGGGLTKSGTGTFTLAGDNTYTGATTVTGGVLVVNGSQGQSNVTVNSTATLGGTGSVGTVTVQSNGRIDPGSGGPGTLNTKQVTFNSGSIFALQLNGIAPGQFDVLNGGTSNISLGNATLSGTVGFSPNIGDSFTIIQTTGVISGSFSNGSVAFIGGMKFTVTITPTNVVLTRVAANTSVALSSSKNPSVLGDPVTFTAIVTPEAGATGVPDGTVEFYDGNDLIGSATIDATGRAQFTTNNLPLGSRQITAKYLGGANFAPSTSAVFTQNVNSGEIGSLTIVDGNNQHAVVNQAFATGLSVLVKDTDGNPMVGVAVLFTAPSGTGPGGNFSGQPTATATTNAQGIAVAPTFTANTKAGAFNVIASTATFTVNFDLTNDADVATKLAILQQPTTTAAGVAINPAVRVGLTDQFDNLTNSTAQVTVALGSNPSSDTLQGTLTVNAAGGVAVFSDLKLVKAATGYTLVFSSTGLANVTSNAFNITAADAAKLVITMAARVRSGASFQLTVTAQDEFGNTATNYLGSVTFTNNKGKKGLPADYTFTATDAGVHVFTASPARLGQQTITVKDKAPTPVLQNGAFTFWSIFGNRLHL